jgi:NB-ARC domain
MPIARNKDFFGRDTYLNMIEKAFFDQSPTSSASITSEIEGPKTFAICGPGGIGKTQLAAKFVYTFQDRFDAIFWIHADKAAKITEGFGKIAAELGLVDDDSPDARDPVVIREQVRHWLVDPVKGDSSSDNQTGGSASWLIVFDNVDDVDELEDYWPLDGAGCVLFTSRDPYAKDSQWARTGVELKPFDLEDSSYFLSRITKKEGEDGMAVAKILGGLPLAMTQMAAWIVRQGLSFSDFVKTYEEEESHQELFDQKLHRKSRGSQYEHNIASVWALGSLRFGGVLLDTISFLDADGIHEKILNSNPHVVALNDYPRTATTYMKARAELIHSSIVSKDKHGERLIVHRLVQDTARSRMSQERYRTMLTTAVKLVSSIWPYEAFGWRHGVARWRVCEELFPHILRFKDLAHYVQPPLGSNVDDFELIKLMNDAGWYVISSIVNLVLILPGIAMKVEIRRKQLNFSASLRDWRRS